jgi:hypothetical protein
MQAIGPTSGVHVSTGGIEGPPAHGYRTAGWCCGRMDRHSGGELHASAAVERPVGSKASRVAHGFTSGCCTCRGDRLRRQRRKPATGGGAGAVAPPQAGWRASWLVAGILPRRQACTSKRLVPATFPAACSAVHPPLRPPLLAGASQRGSGCDLKCFCAERLGVDSQQWVQNSGAGGRDALALLRCETIKMSALERPTSCLESSLCPKLR